MSSALSLDDEPFYDSSNVSCDTPESMKALSDMYFTPKNNPEYEDFSSGPPSNLGMQDVMFRNTYATEDPEAIHMEKIGDKWDNPIVLDDDDDDNNVTSLAIKKENQAKSKFASTVKDEPENDTPFSGLPDKVKAELVAGDKTGSCSGIKKDVVPSIKEVLAMIRECGVKEGTSLFYTAGKLAVSRDHRELIAAFETNEGRLDWLKRAHADMNKKMKNVMP